jgi:hypothetical protein
MNDAPMENLNSSNNTLQQPEVNNATNNATNTATATTATTTTTTNNSNSNAMEMSTHEPPPPSDQQQNGTDSAMIGSAHLRPVFLGLLDYHTTVEDIEDLFLRPTIRAMEAIPVDRVDLKRGYAFVFFREATSQADKERLERYVEEINGMYVWKNLLVVGSFQLEMSCAFLSTRCRKSGRLVSLHQFILLVYHLLSSILPYIYILHTQLRLTSSFILHC